MAIKSSNEGGLIPPLRAIPKKPSDPNNKYLAPDGGNNGKPSWRELPDLSEILSRLTNIETRLNAIESRLDGASIDAQCQDGTVVVTLNL